MVYYVVSEWPAVDSWPQNTPKKWPFMEGVQMITWPCQVLKAPLKTPCHGRKSPGGLREVPERPTDSPRSRSFLPDFHWCVCQLSHDTIERKRTKHSNFWPQLCSMCLREWFSALYAVAKVKRTQNGALNRREVKNYDQKSSLPRVLKLFSRIRWPCNILMSS